MLKKITYKLNKPTIIFLLLKRQLTFSLKETIKIIVTINSNRHCHQLICPKVSSPNLVADNCPMIFSPNSSTFSNTGAKSLVRPNVTILKKAIGKTIQLKYDTTNILKITVKKLTR